MLKKIYNLFKSLYSIIKKIVLLIFSLFYGFCINLPKLIFILFILSIAFVAQHLDEEEDEFFIVMKEESEPLKQPDTEIPKQSKPMNLLEVGQGFVGSSSGSYPEEYSTSNNVQQVSTSNCQEAITYEAVSSNIVAFYRNSLVDVYPNSNILVVPTGMAQDLAKNITMAAEMHTKNMTAELSGQQSINNDDNNQNNFAWSPNTSSSDIEHIVSMFQEGSQITVFTPSSAGTVATLERDPANTPVSSNNTPAFVQPQPVKPAVIIITNFVKAGDPPPALPSWTNIGYNHEDYHIKRNRFDNMYHSEYENNHVDHTKPSDRNQEWLNNKDGKDLGLDRILGKDSQEKKD